MEAIAFIAFVTYQACMPLRYGLSMATIELHNALQMLKMSDFWPQTLKSRFFWVNGTSKSITRSNEKKFNFYF